MAIKAQVEKLDDVEEQYRSLYVQRGDKFELSVELGLGEFKSFTDFANLNNALRKEREDHRTLRETVKPLGDRKVTDVIAALDRIPELEAQVAAAGNKVDQSKIDELVNARLASKLSPVERELATTKEALTQALGQVEHFQHREVQRTIGDSVREAASKLKVVDTATDDIILLAERVFQLDESGKVVAKDNVGCIPGISPEVWLQEMQSKRPHWWGPSVGGGAGGAGKPGSFTTNPWSRDNWNLTEQSRIYKENPTKAEQLARTAGTTIGGKRPT